jgi:hypothetical protein
MACNYQGKIVTNGLVLCLDAADKKSYPGTGTTWLDRSGNGNNGILTNGPTFSNSNAGSIVLDGVDDYITKDTLSAFNVYCISMWVKPSSLINSTSSAKVLIQLRHNILAGNYSWYISFGAATILANNEYITIAGVQENTRTCVVDGGNLNSNTWYNLVFNYENSEYKIYVNNILKPTVSAGGGGHVGLLSNPNKLSLGSLIESTNPPNLFLDANIAQVLIYNRALSPTEIQQNFNATRGRFGI